MKEDALPLVIREYDELRKNVEEPDYHCVIKRHLTNLSNLTQRDTLVYISGWPQKQVVVGSKQRVDIDRADADAISELIKNLKCDNGLDIIMHSPGGNVGAAKLIVNTIRSKADDVRVIIPQYAMSAASMIACSANKLLMGKMSFMGPTDPQMKIDKSGTVASASDILADYEMICKDLQHSGSHLAFGVLLARYDPGLISRCKKVKVLAKEFVEESLRKYMFRDMPEADSLAAKHAHWLCEEQNQHELYISREALLDRNFPVETFEEHPSLEHEVMCIFYAASIVMTIIPNVTKIVDNQLGEQYISFV